MRTAIVKASELGNDWRAEAHVQAPLKTVNAARIRGWNSGSRGTITFARETHHDTVYHGRLEVREAFQEGYIESRKARAKYLKRKK